jgi:hypothetical protein
MKKFMKLVVAVGAVVGGAAGVLYFLDKKKSDEMYDDFDDDAFDDVFDDEDDERDYVTLDMEDEGSGTEEEKEDTAE